MADRPRVSADRRLVSAAIQDARSQLPPSILAIICVGDVPTRIAEEVIVPHLEQLAIPDHIQVIGLWSGDSAVLFYPERASSFMALLFGSSGTAG